MNKSIEAFTRQMGVAFLILLSVALKANGDCVPVEQRIGVPSLTIECPGDRIGIVRKVETYQIRLPYYSTCDYVAKSIDVYGNGLCYPRDGCCASGNTQYCWPDFHLSVTRRLFWGKDIYNKYANPTNCSDGCPNAVQGSCFRATSPTAFTVEFTEDDCRASQCQIGGGGGGGDCELGNGCGYKDFAHNGSNGGCPFSCYADPYSNCCTPTSPILLDIAGNGFDLTGFNNPVMFDMTATGHPIAISWTAAGSDEAFLVLDLNGNGRIDDGTELFGNFTPQMPSRHRNGFIALAQYDQAMAGGNLDGRIDRRDAIFSSLRLWQDINHNGISEPSELYRLPALGVFALDLDYRESRRQDQYGNRFRYRAQVYDSRGTSVGRWAWDVFFVTQ